MQISREFHSLFWLIHVKKQLGSLSEADQRTHYAALWLFLTSYSIRLSGTTLLNYVFVIDLFRLHCDVLLENSSLYMHLMKSTQVTFMLFNHHVASDNNLTSS